MACVVSLDVNDNGFFVATDDPVELVTDDAVTDDAVTDDAAIACWAKPAESEWTEIQVTWFSPV